MPRHPLFFIITHQLFHGSQIEANSTREEGATQPDMAELMQRMADLKVRGTTTAAGYLVFSVIDFIQHARINTPTYEAATWRYRDLINRHNEAVRHEVVMIKLPRGDSTYQTPSMTLRGLQMLLMLMGNKVEPEFLVIRKRTNPDSVKQKENESFCF